MNNHPGVDKTWASQQKHLTQMGISLKISVSIYSMLMIIVKVYIYNITTYPPVNSII
jgi:hypothetical protein